MKLTIDQMRAVWCGEHCAGEEHLEQVDDELTGAIKYGNSYKLVVKDKRDGTHWAVDYRVENGGDYNDLRDEELTDADVYQVRQHEVVTKSWERVRQQ